jgi:hypothetical protein
MVAVRIAMAVLTYFKLPYYNGLEVKVKSKAVPQLPWRHMEGEEVQLLLILNLGTR